jgi:hypothetical protein
MERGNYPASCSRAKRERLIFDMFLKPRKNRSRVRGVDEPNCSQPDGNAIDHWREFTLQSQSKTSPVRFKFRDEGLLIPERKAARIENSEFAAWKITVLSGVQHMQHMQQNLHHYHIIVQSSKAIWIPSQR